eukprot:1783956-Pleurochrysis_carterae.AAC.1
MAGGATARAAAMRLGYKYPTRICEEMLMIAWRGRVESVAWRGHVESVAWRGRVESVAWRGR